MQQIEMFSAGWCTSCRALKPAIESFAEENKVELIYKDVDSPENMAEATAAGVKSLPFVRLKQDGEVVKSFVGVKSLKEIEDWYNEE